MESRTLHTDLHACVCALFGSFHVVHIYIYVCVCVCVCVSQPVFGGASDPSFGDGGVHDDGAYGSIEMTDPHALPSPGYYAPNFSRLSSVDNP